MDGIKFDVGGKKLLFATTGEVAEVAANGGTTTQGRWDSSSTQHDNKFRYKLGQADQTPLQAVYSFNETNQLVVVLTDGTKKSDPFTFQGRIAVDRDHNIGYVLV